MLCRTCRAACCKELQQPLCCKLPSRCFRQGLAVDVQSESAKALPVGRLESQRACIHISLTDLAHGHYTKSATGTLTSSLVTRSLMRTAPSAHSSGASSTSRAAPHRSACCSICHCLIMCAVTTFFCWLRKGTDFPMPSPGHGSLRSAPKALWCQLHRISEEDNCAVCEWHAVPKLSMYRPLWPAKRPYRQFKPMHTAIIACHQHANKATKATPCQGSQRRRVRDLAPRYARRHPDHTHNVQGWTMHGAP